MKLSKQQRKEYKMLSDLFGDGVDLVAFAEKYPEPPKYKNLGMSIDANGNIHLEIEKDEQ